MLNKVIGLKPAGTLSLHITFADGASGVFDFGPVLRDGGPVGRQVIDSGAFPRVFLEFGAPTWPNGYDVCPDWLRMEMAAAGELRHSAAAE